MSGGGAPYKEYTDGVCVCVCVCATTFDARTPAPIARREVRETLGSVLSAEGVVWGDGMAVTRLMKASRRLSSE